jgi:hypothetical protein
MPRTDKGTKRTKYNITYDKTGKTQREGRFLVSFWKEHTVEGMMGKTEEELDQTIDLFLERFEARQLKRDKNWWYPDIQTTLNEIRNKKTKYVDKPFG